MWIWDQSEGCLYHHSGDNTKLIAKGYSGRDWAKNNPKAEKAKALGPIPKGMWKIGRVYTSHNTGPYTITLDAYPETETYRRSAFRIHGDSIKNPGTASHGCIILARGVRLAIIASGDLILEVIE